ncbi:hypothetical protein [Prauserella muralis]|uniref:Uncharacterized protein n=1 Tax=Prauserella muralis TaxID=588067 RepID=A0A2V4AGL0_9PSEU|nr:hypothetical protein [Prauserella muralis]PXY19055.1 hypothetical protein BAY60_30030 [Prauserella muralis]TWE28952.1 hypothetical protein FHX69_1621 [Prauserella muralis]
MKRGAQVAVAVGAGYLLGRSRKGRLALMLAAASATGKVGGPGALLRQGAGKLASSPELGQITESVKGDLLGAARSAAMSAATERIGSLNERLASGGAPRRGGADDEQDDTGQEPETAEQGTEREAEADYDEADAGDEQEPEPESDSDEEQRRPVRRRRSAQPRSSGQSRGSTQRAPVRRTRR